jgi:type I restriction enzyme, S subunit
MKFGLEENIVAKLNEVFEANSKVDKAWIFGSRAKGNFRPDSDIDVAIKGAGITLDDILKMQMAFEENRINLKIDLVNYDTISETALIEHIDRVGNEIYSKWKKLKLGDTIKLKRGYDLPSQSRTSGLIPIFSSSGISGYHDYAMKEGPGVITGRYGTIGKVFYTDSAYWPLNTTLYVQDFKGNFPKFIYYFLKGLDFEKYSDKSAVPGINRNEVHKEEILLPPRSEQIAIADVLSSLDDKIDLLHRQNKTLEQLAETLFRRWFVVQANENWETKTVSEVVDVRDGTHDSPKQTSSGKYLITSKHLKPAGIDFANAYRISEQDFTEVNKRSKVEKDDILFSMIGTLGLIHYVNDEPDFAIKNMGLFKTSEKREFAKFLYLLIKSPIGEQFIHENASGSTQEYITLGSLRNFEFKHPGEARIQQFDNLVEPIFQKIYSNSIQIRTVTRLRDAVLPKLMSGEVRIDLADSQLTQQVKSKNANIK